MPSHYQPRNVIVSLFVPLFLVDLAFDLSPPPSFCGSVCHRECFAPTLSQRLTTSSDAVLLDPAGELLKQQADLVDYVLEFTADDGRSVPLQMLEQSAVLGSKPSGSLFCQFSFNTFL